jgi:hypothetical protein
MKSAAKIEPADIFNALFVRTPRQARLLTIAPRDTSGFDLFRRA